MPGESDTVDLPRGASIAAAHGVTVVVVPQQIDPRQAPDPERWCFAYRVSIRSDADGPVRLLEREWTVIDAEGERREIRGVGVVGEQPRIEPGHAFVYTSWVPLDTAWGTMEGRFLMRRDDGSTFWAPVGRFHLVGAPA